MSQPDEANREAMLVPAVPDDLCLAYANTLSWRGTETPAESLRELADVLAFVERLATIDANATQPIRAWSQRFPGKAAEVFAEALALREVVFRIFSAAARGEPVSDPDFAALKDAMALAPGRGELACSDGRYGWVIDGPHPSAPSILAPVLWSGADLMLKADRQRIRQCANDKCLWLFVDESKTGTRRWCDMSSCGNRAKAHRHYLKTKGA